MLPSEAVRLCSVLVWMAKMLAMAAGTTHSVHGILPAGMYKVARVLYWVGPHFFYTGACIGANYITFEESWAPSAAVPLRCLRP